MSPKTSGACFRRTSRLSGTNGVADEPPVATRYRYSPNILRYVLDREFERTDRTISRAESIGKMQISILLF
jgi:hypothetical protein